MLVALLVLLGVDLVLIVAFIVLVVARRRWLARQPGGFAGAVRVVSGVVEGLDDRWQHGRGRWVSDVLVWSRRPLLLRTNLIAVDALTGRRNTAAHEVARLGDQPVVVRLDAAGAVVEVAVRSEHLPLALGAFQQPDFNPPPSR